MLKKILESSKILLPIIIIIFYICLNWLKPGFVISHAEEGLIFYNPQRTYEIARHAWYPHNLGYAVPFLSAKSPFYLLVALLFHYGIPSYFIQIVFFFIFLTIPIVFFRKLIETYEPKYGTLIGLIASLIYIFNFYTQTQVFNRMLYPLIIFWSTLPMFLYLWVNWLEKAKYRYLISFLFFSTIFSYMYSIPSSIIGLWFLLALFSISKNKFKRKILLALVGFVFWIFASSWWLGDMFFLRNNDYSHMTNTQGNIQSLIEVSEFYQNSDILLLKQKYFFDRPGYFQFFYNVLTVKLVAFFLLLMTIIGLVRSLLLKKFYIFIVVFVVFWFFVKGSNIPFGEVFYKTIFSTFPITQVLRNPYEKLGSIFVLMYSFFASIGIFYVSKFFKNYRRLSQIVITFTIIFILGKPLYTGKIFYAHYYTKVPEYYQWAAQYIKNDGDGRILYLPYRSVSNVEYNWNYKGEDVTRFLFSNPGISGTIPQHDMQEFFINISNNIDDEDIIDLLNVMNVDYLVVDYDLKQDSSYSGNATYFQETIEKWSDIQKIDKFGNLIVYKVNNEPDLGYFYTLSEVVFSKDIDNMFNYILTDKYKPHEQAIVFDEERTVLNDFLVVGNKPTISFIEIDPENYQVKIENSKGPFVLLFSMKYNNYWSAKIDDSVIDKHFRANGFANAWFVDKEGDFYIDIKFDYYPLN